MDRPLILAPRKGQNAGGGVSLRFDLIRPVCAVGLHQRIAQQPEFLDFGFGGGDVAGPGRTHGAGERDHGLGPWKAVPREGDRRRGERGSLGPAPPLECEAGWDRCDGVRDGEAGGRFAERSKLVNDLLRLAILRGLQIGVYEIIHRVQRFLVPPLSPRRTAGGAVRLYRVRP